MPYDLNPFRVPAFSSHPCYETVPVVEAEAEHEFSSKTVELYIAVCLLVKRGLECVISYQGQLFQM